jgi:hypothetical protein
MDTKELMRTWDNSAARLRKPKLEEACDVILDLCIELNKINKEVEYQKNRQDIKEQFYKTMMIELHNVVSKYT